MNNMKQAVMVLCMVIAIIDAKNMCSNKIARKNFKNRLDGSKDAENVFVEARFVSKNLDSYRFEIREHWPVHNGNLKFGQEFQVHPMDSSCPFSSRADRHFFLAMKPHINGEAGSFQLLEAPVPITVSRVRRTIHNKFCGGDSSLCPTRIFLPNETTMLSSSHQTVYCKVQTTMARSDYTVSWKKNDGTRYTKDGDYDTLSLDENDDGELGLAFNFPKFKDIGTYTCEVRSKKDGEVIATAAMRFNVHGNSYERCDRSQCSGMGNCYFHLSTSTKICHCDPGLIGADCGELDLSLPNLEATRGVKDEDMNRQVQNLTIVVTLMAVLVIMATVAALYNTQRVKHMVEKLAKSRRHHIVKKVSRFNTSTSSLPTPAISNNSYRAVSTSPTRN